MNRMTDASFTAFRIDRATDSIDKEIKNIAIIGKHYTAIDGVLSESVSVLNADYIEKNEVFTCYSDDSLVGFFAIQSNGYFGHLDWFCLLSEYVILEREAQIMEAIKKVAKECGFNYLTVIGDQSKEAFYLGVGAQVSEEIKSSISGMKRSAFYVTVVMEHWIDLPTVGLVVVQGNTLLLAYSNNKKAWYLPGGKIDAQEENEAALIREIKEELSLELQPDRLNYLTHIVAPAYGEKKNIMMQQACFLYDLQQDKIQIANEIGGVRYFTREEYSKNEIPVPGVLKVFDYLTQEKHLK